MRMDTIFELIREEKIPDGMGGYIISDIYPVYGGFKALKLPVTAEKLLEEHGIVSTKALKLFTREELPHEIDLIQEPYNDFQQYSLLQFNDYGKFKMLLVEEVD